MAEYTNFDLKKFLAENKNTEAKEVQKEELDITAEETVSELDGTGTVDALTALIGAGGLAGGAVALNKLMDSLEAGKLGEKGKAVAKFLRDAGKTFSGAGLKEEETTVELTKEEAFKKEIKNILNSDNKLTSNSISEDQERDHQFYANKEEAEKIQQIMSTVKKKIGFDYPVFKDIVDDAINLMDEQPGTDAIDALYSTAEMWNEEYQDNGDENGEDITSRMMSILDSMQA